MKLMNVKLMVAVVSLLCVTTSADAAGRRQWSQPQASPFQAGGCQGGACQSQAQVQAQAGQPAGVVVVGESPSEATAFAAAPLPVTSALAQVNAQRAARGLPPFHEDPNLTAAAHAAASYRAAHRLFGHVPGTPGDFGFLPPGVHADAGGCAAYPASYGFMACATYESYTYAGAASVPGPDGRIYHHLFVRGGSAAGSSVQRASMHASGPGGSYSSRSVSRTGSGWGLFRRR